MSKSQRPEFLAPKWGQKLQLWNSMLESENVQDNHLRQTFEGRGHFLQEPLVRQNLLQGLLRRICCHQGFLLRDLVHIFLFFFSLWRCWLMHHCRGHCLACDLAKSFWETGFIDFANVFLDFPHKREEDFSKLLLEISVKFWKLREDWWISMVVLVESFNKKLLPKRLQKQLKQPFNKLTLGCHPTIPIFPQNVKKCLWCFDEAHQWQRGNHTH